MNQNLLTTTAEWEETITGLSGRLKLDDFSGIGEGWFNNSDIKIFCTSLIQLSTTMKGKAELIGAERKPDGNEYVETFALRAYTLTSSKLNGVIGIHCTLAKRTTGSVCRTEEIRKMSAEVKVRNQRLKIFAEDMQKLMNREIKEVTLICDLDVFCPENA
jgi:hypothetical protein